MGGDSRELRAIPSPAFGEFGCAEDTNNLEGWTIQQMLSHASGDAFVGPNVVLQAIKDIRARHKRRSPMAVTVRISNVTMWRREVADWIKSTSDHILLVQETHLGPSAAREATNYMHRQGFQMYGGIRCGRAGKIPHSGQG